MKDSEDAFGHSMYDYFLKQEGTGEIVERDDSFVNVSGGAEVYFSEYNEWPELEKRALRYVRGRVLDIGCGAGRHSLFLQEKGYETVGIDSSPLAIEVCRQRGVKNVQLVSITDLSSDLGIFDTILMLGNNFSLLGTPSTAKELLGKFHTLTSEQGRIIAQTRDPYQTDMAEHLEYHEANKKKGNLPGEATIRIRYKKYATSWFKFMLVSQTEMVAILEATNWHVTEFIDGEKGYFVAIIEKC
ncbi:MAG: class I SAM-dependent methyltransferase [Candidatus Thorarchaeota archaeon]